MPRGTKRSTTSKQRRGAHHIEEGAKKRGYSAKRGPQMGYAAMTKEEGGKKPVRRKGMAARKGGRTMARGRKGR